MRSVCRTAGLIRRGSFKERAFTARLKPRPPACSPHAEAPKHAVPGRVICGLNANLLSRHEHTSAIGTVGTLKA